MAKNKKKVQNNKPEFKYNETPRKVMKFIWIGISLVMILSLVGSLVYMAFYS